MFSGIVLSYYLLEEYVYVDEDIIFHLKKYFGSLYNHNLSKM